MAHCWGIDLGGTKIEIAVLDPLGDVLLRKRISTEQSGGYKHVLGQVKQLVRSASIELGLEPKSIGVGHPGVIDPVSQTLKNSNTQCLNSKPIKEDLGNLLGVSLVCANDANCFALAEARLGAGREAESVFGVILGTGVGGGLVIRGKVLGGAQGIGGEWGHNIVLENGPLCYCGKRGCVETVISGPALEHYYQTLSAESLSLSDIVERAEGGEDLAAQRTIARLTHFFARAISVVINIIDPDVIVLGGGLSKVGCLYQSAAREIENFVFNTELGTQILENQLGDSAGVFGAAMLVQDKVK